ncbi:MAG: Daunorubicin/doxorubicin resistance ATP-binding protein DrrA [Elusimicrobia bacterium]|nr:Daunorubicin/doxorubicin resistance ATP-binding protein DrrA [Elusimicrobiota bacterium]
MKTGVAPAVQVVDVNHSYTVGKKTRQVLDHLNITVKRGEIFGLLGPNGGGKTTLFKILSTAIPLTSGEVKIFDFDLKTQAHQIRNKMGVVFQHPSLDKKLTLLENIETQGVLYGLGREEIKSRSSQLLKKFSLLDRAHDFVEHLSGGLQRRAEIVKALLHEPELLLMDEPSTGLDPGSRRDLWDLLNNLKNEGVTILLTTHLMEEADKCDRVSILHHGRTIKTGTPNDLKNKIGGDMIVVHADQLDLLSSKIHQTFGLTPILIDNTLRIEMAEGHKFIPKLVESFPGLIKAVSVGKPTLEDVFVHETGQAFEDPRA